MDIETEAEVYVVYTANEGFVTGRAKLRYTTKLVKARVYNRRCDATNSMNQWASKNGESHVIPVTLTLDSKSLFKTLLRGRK